MRNSGTRRRWPERREGGEGERREAELAERKADFDRELSETAADRARLTQRLSEAEGALDRARRDHRSFSAEIDRLTQCEADLTAQLGDAQAARHPRRGGGGKRGVSCTHAVRVPEEATASARRHSSARHTLKRDWPASDSNTEVAWRKRRTSVSASSRPARRQTQVCSGSVPT